MKFKKISNTARVNEGLTSTKKEAVQTYKKLACLEEGVKIEESSLDKWAFDRVCNQYSMPAEDLREALLTEDEDASPAAEKAASELDAEISEADDKSELEKELDWCLKRALRSQGRTHGKASDYPNLLIEGSAGFAKTSIVKQWADKNGVNLYAIDLAKAGPEKIGGIVGYDPENPSYAKELGNKQLLDALSKPRTVLFLDEYNRAKASVRATVLKLVQEHVIPSGEGDLFMPNLLFTVAAINPVSSAYGGVNQSDMAELTRFKHFMVKPSRTEHLKYLNREYDKEMEDAKDAGDEEWMQEVAGRKALANALLSDRRFEYTPLSKEEQYSDDSNFRATSYRSLKQALDDSDGTKDSLLKVWNDFCDYTQKKTIEDILKNFVDVKDKANDALKGGTKSSVFTKSRSNYEKILDIISGNS